MKQIIRYTTILALFISASFLIGCDDEMDEMIDVIASFTQNVSDEEGTITFLNTSENAKTYAWDFGDGTNSTEINPTKTFATGTYIVKLTATNGDFSSTFSDTVMVQVIEDVTVPIDFDNENVDYTPTTFNGTAFSIVTNPDLSGTNDQASNVGSITNSGAEFEGIFFDLGTPVDLSTDMAISMNFWSNTPIDILLKLEEGTTGPIETTGSHGGTGWETLTFNFSSTAQFSRLTMFVDGFGTTAGTFYVDDIKQTEVVVVPIDPTTAAPTPTQAASDVISIYSDAYTDVARDGFNFYGAAAFEEVAIEAGNSALKYTFSADPGGNFQVIELGGANQIDAAAAGMTNFRFDLWFPNELDAASSFLMKLVDFGTTTSEALINVNATSNPAIAQGSWLQFDIPFSELQTNGLAASSNLQQVVIDLVTSGVVYVDNIYFYKSGGGSTGGAPTSPAPTPTQAAADVISIYSDAYTDVARDGFNFYGAADFAEESISGNGALKYTFNSNPGGNFQVIELGGANQIDATTAGMTNFRFDIWFPNAVDASTEFLMKVVDFGATTTEAQIRLSASSTPVISQGAWLQVDIPFADLQSNGLGASANIQQVVIDLINSGEVYIDNIYFYKENTGPIVPTVAAPTPTQAAADVISIYSDAYTDVARDGFNFYGAADFAEEMIGGGSALKYTFNSNPGGNFQVIELGGANQIDATAAGMTNFRFDVWFPNATDASTEFLIKVVDFGATTTEAQIRLSSSSTPAISQGAWLQVDIPFTELMSNGLGASANIQQVVIDLINAGEVYLDNIYFYKSGGGSGGTSIIDLQFEDAASINDWQRIGDANSADASITWVADGGVSSTGAMQLSASNSDPSAGRAYIFQLDATGLDYDGATDVKLTFDLKLVGGLTASAVHLQTNIPGTGVTNNFDLQASGLNDATFTNYSFDFSGVDAAATTFTIHFNFAAGAVMDAGGVLLVDNIKLVKN